MTPDKQEILNEYLQRWKSVVQDLEQTLAPPFYLKRTPLPDSPFSELRLLKGEEEIACSTSPYTIRNAYEKHSKRHRVLVGMDTLSTLVKPPYRIEVEPTGVDTPLEYGSHFKLTLLKGEEGVVLRKGECPWKMAQYYRALTNPPPPPIN